MVSVGHEFTQGTVRTNYLHSTTYETSAVNHQMLGAGVFIKLIHSVSGGYCWVGAWLEQSAGRPHMPIWLCHVLWTFSQHGGWIPRLRGERESNKEKEQGKSCITVYDKPHRSHSVISMVEPLTKAYLHSRRGNMDPNSGWVCLSMSYCERME